MAQKGSIPEAPTGLDWIQLKKDMDNVVQTETPWEKIKRKSLENPLVPIGTIATVAALTYGLVCFKRGESRMQQHMMRSRVVAQLFTVIAAVGGVMMTLPKEKRNYAGLKESGQSANRMPTQ